MNDSDDRKTAKQLAPLVPFALASAWRMPDAFSFTVLAVLVVLTTVTVLVCWRRNIDHAWEREDEA